MIKWKVGSMQKLSEFYTAEVVKSHLHLYRCRYHHNCVDIDALAVGSADVDEGPIA